jgi:putative hydrolase of the HAD superfamily
VILTTKTRRHEEALRPGTNERMAGDIEVVFLDAGGTMFEVRGSVGQIYSRFGLRYGCSLDPRDIDKTFVEAFKTAPPLAFPGLDESEACVEERLWWKETMRRTLKSGMPESAFENYFEEIFEFFKKAEAWHLFPDTRPSLERLRRRGYRLGIVSNSDARLHDVLSALELNCFFDRVTVSSRAGAAKPSAAIFHKALAAMKVSGSRAVHAGDSLEEDVEGARRAGLRAFLVDRQERYQGWTGGFRVRNLEELCRTLGS